MSCLVMFCNVTFVFFSHCFSFPEPKAHKGWDGGLIGWKSSRRPTMHASVSACGRPHFQT